MMPIDTDLMTEYYSCHGQQGNTIRQDIDDFCSVCIQKSLIDQQVSLLLGLGLASKPLQLHKKV